MTSHRWAPTVVVEDPRLARMLAAPASDLGIALAAVPSGAASEVVLPVCRSVLASPEVFSACGVRSAAARGSPSAAGDVSVGSPQLRLSMSLARSPSGQAVAYAIAALTVTDGRRVVVAPAPELPEEIGTALTLAGLELVRRHRVVGVHRLELAMDDQPANGTGQVTRAPAYRLVDVVAGPDEPGDWTLDGCLTGQYEQHLRAVLDLPLGDPALRAPWTVAAWAYDQGYGPVYPAYRHVLARDPAIRIRLYGGDVPTGQALGLVAASGADLAPVLDRAEHAADYLTGVVTE